MLIYKVIWHINAIIKMIWFKIIYGKSIRFGSKTTFRKRYNLVIENGAKVRIGDNCFFNNDCSINAQEYIEIGDNCIFGENVKIYDHNHIFKEIPKLITKQGYSADKIKIGNNCWICSNVIILKGVEIGNNCVIGAGCIIEKNIEDNSMVKRDNNIQNKITKIGVKNE